MNSKVSAQKGKVKKIVRFTEIKKAVYNRAFGDLDELTGEISDTIVTNNNDSKKCFPQ
jgi:hypothetical protein